MKPLAPNTLLQNRYLIVHLIGKGGMGEVYLAVDQRLGSAIALKRTFFSHDEMLGNAFEREARTLARLRHPVLPKVSDHFTENDTQYLVMEHITGDDLSKRLEITNKPFPLNWVLFWADQLLDALAYLHGHEPPIVHRDIKPQNLKLTDENHIVLLDFGLAKNSIGNTKVSSTTGGSIVGYTPHYASMEQIRGTGTNPRSDIYSMAATFYQLLTNIVPPDALTRADSVLNGSPDPTKPLTEINPEVPRAISNVILKGMALSMDQRFANAREMQKALREAYAEIQAVMSEKTLALNTPAPVSVQNQVVPQSQQHTEQFSVGNGGGAAQIPSENAHSQPSAAASNLDSFSESKSDGFTSGASSQPKDFDATMKYESDAMIGFKTEVLPAEKMPSAEDYASNPAPQNFNGMDADYSKSAQEEEFNPEATIAPFVSFDQAAPQPITSDYDSQPKTDDNYAAATAAAVSSGNSFAVNKNTAPAVESAAFTPTPVYSEPKKKSGGSGKTLAIAGGIGGLGIVAIAVAAGAWYTLRPAEVKVDPTPQVQASVAPTVEPSVAPSIETATNPDNSSTETVSPTSENSSETATTETTSNEKSAVTTPEKNTERPTQQTVQQQTQPVRTVPTPRVVIAKTPPPTVAKTPAPAKTPAKTGRTDILQ